MDYSDPTPTEPMNESLRETIPSAHPQWQIQVTDDGSRTLISRDSRTAFHSASGALSETRHVYFENSGVSRRLRGGMPTSVLEIGLGTAMGMLLTLAAPRVAGTPLHYTAVELEWLPAGLIRQLHPHHWIAAQEKVEDLGKDAPEDVVEDAAGNNLVERFLGWRESLPEVPPPGTYRWDVDNERTATVDVGSLESWMPAPGQRFDAIYFDPFAPDTNGELWTAPVLARMHSLLSADGTLVSYCVNRKVRDLLSSVGFEVQRVPGPPGGKREVLVATRARCS